MVNFKIPAYLFAFASCAMAATFPHDNLAPRGIASPVFDEKSIIARDIAVAEPVHELEARQSGATVEAQVESAINVFVKAALPFVIAIEGAAANKTATTAEVAAVINVNLNGINVLLNVLVAALRAIAALKLQITITAALKVVLTALVSILVKVALALYLRLNIDLVALLKLIIGPITVWLDLWVQVAVELKLIVTAVVGVLISIAAGLGLNATIAAALGWQKLQGYYY